ncbi:MAG: type 2 isopentenyl-diphosphate Delta-isomerase [Candidatus Hadarchaeales archaeon]
MRKKRAPSAVEGTSETSRRKESQLRICLSEDVEMKEVPGFGQLHFVNLALPELNLADVKTEIRFLGKELSAPLIISAMTGGHREGERINRRMAKIAQEFGIAFCVGSMHAALERPELARTYQVRDVAPDVLLLANLSASQLTEGKEVEEARRAVEMIGADGLSLHLNPLQEAIQPEGKPVYAGVLSKIQRVCSGLGVPVMVKETGCGISGEIGERLEKAGVSAIDVAGAGGTSWAAVEALRGGRLGRTYRDWGIPTPVCVAELARRVRVPIVAGGGIRSGLDAAKALALGAHAVAMALPLLRSAWKGEENLREFLRGFIDELRLAMFLTGCRRVEDLRKTQLIPVGELADWFRARRLM